MQTQIQFKAIAPFNVISEIEIHYKRAIHSLEESSRIFSSRQAHEAFIKCYDENKIGHKEFFLAMYLNNQNQILAVLQVSEGGINSTIADVRVVLQAALKLNATSFMISHNHPSGSCKPSESDKLLTNKMQAAAKALDINLLDHIIVTPNSSYFSFADDALL